MINPGNVSGVA